MPSLRVRGKMLPLYQIDGGAQTFQKPTNHPKILSTRMVTYNKFYTENSQILGAVIKNVFDLMPWHPGHLYFAIFWNGALTRRLGVRYFILSSGDDAYMNFCLHLLLNRSPHCQLIKSLLLCVHQDTFVICVLVGRLWQPLRIPVHSKVLSDRNCALLKTTCIRVYSVVYSFKLL